LVSTRLVRQTNNAPDNILSLLLLDSSLQVTPEDIIETMKKKGIPDERFQKLKCVSRSYWEEEEEEEFTANSCSFI